MHAFYRLKKSPIETHSTIAPLQYKIAPMRGLSPTLVTLQYMKKLDTLFLTESCSTVGGRRL